MDTLEKLFQSHLSNLGPDHENLIPTFIKEARSLLPKMDDIPPLSSTTNNMSLVRFKCMLHDILDDEYACSLMKNNDIFNHCLFSDVIPEKFELIEKSLVQRSVFYGSNIPGEADWSKTKGSLKRSLDTPTTFDMSEFLIKMVKSDLDEDIKINEIVEFVGVFNENNLYALDFKKLKSPYLATPLKGVIDVRKETIKYFATYFQDELISEYFLIHLLSQIFSRSGNIPHGKFSLNLCNCGKNEVKNITKLIENMYPNSVSIKFNDVLTKKLFSMKNYETNRLEKGFYQLSNGTHLLIDETDISEKELKETEVKNILITKKLIQEQVLPYDFKFYSLDFPVDVPVMSCSVGKSIFDDVMDVSIKLKSCGKVLTDFDMSAIRNYIMHCKHNITDYKIGKEATEYIEQDFVVERKERNILPERLYLWLNLAKLFTLSLGLNELTIDIYKNTKLLENKRRQEYQ